MGIEIRPPREQVWRMAERLRIPLKPVVEVRIPSLTRPPILKLPEYRLGPLGIAEFRRVAPGELLPVRFKPTKEMRER